ncbi:hypothetical protein [Bacillus altitudinis]|nr:hypothetical protein [Bacillus altitudinis]
MVRKFISCPSEVVYVAEPLADIFCFCSLHVMEGYANIFEEKNRLV